MPTGKKGRSPKAQAQQAQREMIRSRDGILAEAAKLALVLADAGFRRTLIEISTDTASFFMAQVIVHEDEINTERFETLQAIAYEHGARVHLDEFYINQTRHARIALWPKRKPKQED